MADTLGELGEFGLIGALVARLPQGRRIMLGPGDDAAVVQAPDGRVVATTDVLVEGRHFRRDWSAAYDVGRKAAAQNLADIAAMGAVPTALLLGLAVPGSLPAAWVLELADGIRDECDVTGAGLAGGDVVAAESIVIAITALGDLGGRAPVTRAGARPGDVVAVAGQLGWSAAGLAVLSGLTASPAGPRLPPGDLPPGTESFVAAHRRPRPPYAAGPAAAEIGATAMIDVSDGLIQDLGHVAKACGVQIDLDTAALEPFVRQLRVPARECASDPLTWVLAGGEDHALAAAFPADVSLPPPWQLIGRVIAGEGVTLDGQRRAGAGGWDHFRGA